MRTRRLVVPLVATAIVVSLRAIGPFDPLTDLLRQAVADRTIAGAVAAVSRRGAVVYQQAVGVQDLATGAPMTERSLFRIYSMTKPVTAAAVMMLHEAGRFDLDDPVSKYLPAFAHTQVLTASGSRRAPSREITVRDLLLHTSGLSHRTADLYQQQHVRVRTDTLPQFVDKIARAPLMDDPGTRFRYSEGTTVLGRLVEIWSGKPFDVFLDERIFKPLRMTETGFWARPDQRGRLATVYQTAHGGLTPFEIEPEAPFTERPNLLEGAVGLVSTVPDFMRFSQMLLNRGELNGVRILQAKTVDMMTANGLPTAVLQARGNGTRGWGLGNVDIAMDTGEYGWDGTAGTVFSVDPHREIITIFMWQTVPADPGGLRGHLKALVQAGLEH